MIGAAFGAGRSEDEPTSRTTYDTYDHNGRPVRYSQPYLWATQKTHIERASGVFSAGFMRAAGAQYAAYPRQRAGHAVEVPDIIMARAVVLTRSNGQVWEPAHVSKELSSTDSRIATLFDYKQRTDTITSMGATPANGLRAWRDVSVNSPTDVVTHRQPHQAGGLGADFGTRMHAATTATATPAAARSGAYMPGEMPAAGAALHSATTATENTMAARDAAQTELHQASQELHAATSTRATQCDELLRLRTLSAAADAAMSGAQAEVRLGELRAEDALDRLREAQSRFAQSKAAHGAAVKTLLEMDLRVQSMADIGTAIGLDPAFPVDGQPGGRSGRWASTTDEEAASEWARILSAESGYAGSPAVVPETDATPLGTPDTATRGQAHAPDGADAEADQRKYNADVKRDLDTASRVRAMQMEYAERRAEREREAAQQSQQALSLALARKLQQEEDTAAQMRAMAAKNTATTAGTATAGAPRASGTATAAHAGGASTSTCLLYTSPSPRD